MQRHGLYFISCKARKINFEMDEVISIITFNIDSVKTDFDKLKWTNDLVEAKLYIQDMEKQWLNEAIEIFHNFGGNEKDPILVGDDVTPYGILVKYEDISKIKY